METIYKSRKFEVVRHQAVGSDGKTRPIEVVHHPGAVVILPLLSEDECILIRNWRHALQQELLELPAGTLDVEGEAADKAALRELEEEAGYRAGKLDKLGEFYPSPGIMNELIQAFVAHDLTRTEQNLGPNEKITVEPMKLNDALKMVRNGEIIDAKTIITLMWWDWKKGSAR